MTAPRISTSIPLTRSLEPVFAEPPWIISPQRPLGLAIRSKFQIIKLTSRLRL
jgi:hypothetical protein